MLPSPSAAAAPRERAGSLRLVVVVGCRRPGARLTAAARPRPRSGLSAGWRLTDRRLRLYLNRQVAKLSHKGQLKISVAVSLPLIAKVEVTYQCDST
ncbi:hypothetical protein, partial [Sinorhizobium meliloti]|uniref:hypothetical protein n=1 Tax=Rhizobium meliloti TaxID=382 RepID=UPI001AEE1FFB